MKVIEEQSVINKIIMRRFVMIEKIKDAEIIGIVIGTMAVNRYREILKRTQQVIKNSGKQYYTFVVGKLNPHKLANFAEVDIFVLISCPESTAFDSRDFFKPIVSPFELEIALH
jgi:diphthamide biosynthesis protein 2